MTASEAFLDSVAEAVRHVWIEEMRMALSLVTGRPSRYRPGKRWDGDGRWDYAEDDRSRKSKKDRETVWHKAAKTLIQHRLPLVEYIHFVAHGAGERFSAARMPQPNMLQSDSKRKRFEEYRQDRGFDNVTVVANLLRHQQLTLRLEAARLQDDAETAGEPLSFQEAVKTVVAGNGYQLRALFRYCKAHALGLLDLQDRLEGAALLEYLHYPEAYETTWGEEIPRRLLKRAERLGGLTI